MGSGKIHTPPTNSSGIYRSIAFQSRSHFYLFGILCFVVSCLVESSPSQRTPCYFDRKFTWNKTRKPFNFHPTQYLRLYQSKAEKGRRDTRKKITSDLCVWNKRKKLRQINFRGLNHEVPGGRLFHVMSAKRKSSTSSQISSVTQDIVPLTKCRRGRAEEFPCFVWLVQLTGLAGEWSPFLNSAPYIFLSRPEFESLTAEWELRSDNFRLESPLFRKTDPDNFSFSHFPK